MGINWQSKRGLNCVVCIVENVKYDLSDLVIQYGRKATQTAIPAQEWFHKPVICYYNEIRIIHYKLPSQ